jgi:undecaprenyl-diphosphooligosaccharide---protein glycotransferase
MTLTDNKKTILFILIAFAFSICIRLIWVNQFSNTPQFKFNGEFMLTTNDAYYYAEGARDILAGVTEDTNDLSPFTSAVSKVTAWIAMILPVSFETVLFYMPAFFSSLVVIPIILIGKTIKKLDAGFIAALLASIAWSYYNRTMVGYYDTDMLNIVFPMFLLWSIIWAIDTKKNIYLVFAALDVLAYRWWYPQSYALEFAFWGMIATYLIYMIYQNKAILRKYYEKSDIVYSIQLLNIMMLAMVQLDMFWRVILLFGYFMLFIQKRWHKYLHIMFLMIVVLFMVTGGFDPIWAQLKGYVFKDNIATDSEGLTLHFFTVMQTVVEAAQIPFATFANRISGHTIVFLLSFIGYIFLLYRHKIMLFSIPMAGLGFLAMIGGLRFTIYAVPVLALGMGYFIYEFSKFLSSKFKNKKIGKVAYYVFLLLFTSGALYPNINHAIGYRIGTVFQNADVKVLDRLKTIANREDYVVSWWDYGYVLRYYSDVKTLSDGGKHSGAVNFPTSYILTNSEETASKMLRLDVEYTEKRFEINTNNKELDRNDADYIKLASSNIEQMTLDYEYDNTNDFLTALETNLKLPEKTRDIYLYLPYAMMRIFSTIELFSNINLMDGTKGNKSFFYTTTKFNETKDMINLSNNIKFYKQAGYVQVGGKKVKVKNFAVTQYDTKGKLNTTIKSINTDGEINVIYMKNYNRFLVLNHKLFNSTYIQLFVLENYDSNLFEPTILNSQVKVYKLKI